MEGVEAERLRQKIAAQADTVKKAEEDARAAAKNERVEIAKQLSDTEAKLRTARPGLIELTRPGDMDLGMLRFGAVRRPLRDVGDFPAKAASGGFLRLAAARATRPRLPQIISEVGSGTTPGSGASMRLKATIVSNSGSAVNAAMAMELPRMPKYV